MNSQQIKIRKILDTLYAFDAKKSENKDWELITSSIASTVYASKPITLLQFTCSTINPKFLLSSISPELYVSIDPKGNNLEPDLPALNKLATELNKIYPTKINIFIGNTDPYYIYSESGSLYPDISTDQLLQLYNKRWETYKNNLGIWIKKQYPQLSYNIISWYELEMERINTSGISFEQQFLNLLPTIEKFFPPKNFHWELNKLRDAFGPNKYFYNLDKPDDIVLEHWIRRKFTEYMLQGFWLKTLFSRGILLQNEKPSDLRSRMYQPLLEEMNLELLPILYPFGIDNSGFQ